MRFLNEYGELESEEPESWASTSGVSALGASGSGVVSIASLSAMFFMFVFENISVSSFSADDRKWVSGAMEEVATASAAAVAAVAALVAVVAVAEVAVGAASKKVVSKVASFSRVADQLVVPFVASSFISLLLCFSVSVFVLVSVFSFQKVVNFKRIFLEKKVTQWGETFIMNPSYINMQMFWINIAVILRGINRPVLHSQWCNHN